jgi:hypothetical protein
LESTSSLLQSDDVFFGGVVWCGLADRRPAMGKSRYGWAFSIPEGGIEIAVAVISRYKDWVPPSKAII